MTDLVPRDKIEAIVGCSRSRDWHRGRAVSATNTFYILHSESCLASGIDLRDCEYSLGLDDGIDTDIWADWMDRPVPLKLTEFGLEPTTEA